MTRHAAIYQDTMPDAYSFYAVAGQRRNIPPVGSTVIVTNEKTGEVAAYHVVAIDERYLSYLCERGPGTPELEQGSLL